MSLERPNILWICTDQQRADTVHALGNERINTPNLDRLCREGTALTRAYCQCPICTPSRASFLTGLYPSRLPCNKNGNARMHLPEGVKLVTRCLADAGYDCGLSGKLHLASAWPGVEERVDDGYRRFWYSHSPHQGLGNGNQYAAWLEAEGRFDEVLDTSNYEPAVQRGVRYREDVPSALHQTTWCCDRALEFMNEDRGGPWLMSVNIFDPHPGYDAPRTYRERYHSERLPAPPFRETDLDIHRLIAETHAYRNRGSVPGEKEQRNKASYYGMIELIDENVGRLLDALERAGQRDNTLVIFMSDHGNLIGDHGVDGKGCLFYEDLVRVPLILSWPGRFHRGCVDNRLTELTDIAPTLAEIGGASLHRCDGRSLVPALTRADYSPMRHETVRCEYYDTLDGSFGRANPPPHRPSYATMTCDERYKLVVYHGSDYGELYDLHRDPDEFDNLWTDARYADERKRLASVMTRTAPVTEDPMPRIGRF